MIVSPTATQPWATEVRQARSAQRNWRERPISERLGFLTRLRRLLVDDADEMCRDVEKDVHRPGAEVFSTDLVPTAEALHFLERQSARILRPHRVPRRDRPIWLWGQRDIVDRRPHGVVGIIGTWNYPVFLNAVQIAQALTAGNAVLWKPSELMPRTAERLHRLFLAAGFPADLLQLLPATREAGPQLVEADIDHLVFTGSAAVGRRIAARLGERLISSTLELSGVDALFVAADADLSLAAQAAWFGMTLNQGQTCLAVRRIFVERSVYPQFLEALRRAARSATPMPVPLALESQVRHAKELLDDARQHGATVWTIGEDSPDAASTMAPALILDAPLDLRICHEATFAPIAAVIPCADLDEAIEQHEQGEYGLGASIFTADPTRAERLAARLSVGVVTVNDVIVPTAHPATPFGGRKSSGWGVTQGAEGLLAMTVPQVVSVRTGRWRPHFQPLDGQSPTAELLRGYMAWKHGRFAVRWSGLRRLLAAAFRAFRSGQV